MSETKPETTTGTSGPATSSTPAKSDTTKTTDTPKPSTSSTSSSSNDTSADSGNSGVRESLLEDSQVRATPQPATVVDSTGVERIVHYPNDWSPAPVEPTEEEIARAAEREQLFRDQRTQRGDAFTDTERVGDTAVPAVEANKAEHGG